MISIKGRYKNIVLPSSWEDLNEKQFVFSNVKLLELLAGKISLQEFRLALLIFYTGYKPSTITRVNLKFYTRLILVSIKYFFKLFPYRFCYLSGLIREWKNIHSQNPDLDEREIINTNLLMLSEQITFPLRPAKTGLEINNRFSRNPLPEIRIGNKKFKGKQFDIGIIIRTNITAREFTDCFDILKAFSETKSEECLNSLCSILYPLLPEHAQNITSNHHRNFTRVHYAIRYSILIWFTGIIQYFMDHPIYKVLFTGTSPDPGSEKISLGMGETIMHLSLSGFGTKTEMENTSVVDYFDLQVKSIKKMIADARSAGAKTEDIVKATKLPYTTIEKLS